MAYDPGPAYRRSSGFRPPHRPNHHGIDFAAPSGTPIPAAAAGEVWYSSEHPSSFGNLVILRHVGRDGTRFYTLYAHQDGTGMPAVGDMVEAGGIIGQCGSTGDSSGPHLHFEVIEGSVQLSHKGPLGVTGERGRLNPDAFGNLPARTSVAPSVTASAARKPVASRAGNAPSAMARKPKATRAVAPKSPGATKARGTAKAGGAASKGRMARASGTASAKPGRSKAAGLTPSRSKTATKAVPSKAKAARTKGATKAAPSRTARARAAAPAGVSGARSKAIPKPKATGATSAKARGTRAASPSSRATRATRAKPPRE